MLGPRGEAYKGPSGLAASRNKAVFEMLATTVLHEKVLVTKMII